MGVDACDYDQDGWIDLFVANIDHEMFSLLEKTSNAITGNIDLTQIAQLPLTSRNIAQMSRIVQGRLRMQAQARRPGTACRRADVRQLHRPEAESGLRNSAGAPPQYPVLDTISTIFC